jgi:catechol 2,3-dioxygenase-like lactoylglutathione lyase family enzyme
MTFESLRPMMMVKNLKETIDFYSDVLGFTVNSTHPVGDDPFWASMSCGKATLMFSFVGEPHAHEEGEEPHAHEPEFNGVLYFDPSGSLEELHAKVKSKVATCGDIDEMPWGMKEFSILDPNGYNLTFGVPLAVVGDGHGSS